MLKISAIIVTYYTGEELFESIDSILKTHNLLEIIVVNNGNTENIINRIKSYDPDKVKLINSGGNIGFARGVNLGVSHALGEYIAIINPDCVLLQADFFDILLTEAAKFQDSYMIGCMVLNKDGSLQRTCVRNIINIKNTFQELLPAKFKSINFSEAKIPKETSYVPAITGAFMMLKKDDYIKIGGLDEKYFIHFEDMDLCFRINKLGKKIVYVPSAVCKHYLSTSNVPKEFVEKEKVKSFSIYFRKNYEYLLNFILIELMILLFYARFKINCFRGKYGKVS